MKILKGLIKKRNLLLHRQLKIKHRKAIVTLFTAVLLTMFLAQIWFSTDAIPITGPLVLQLGNDAVVRDSAKQLSQEIDEARLFYVDSLVELSLICRKATGQLFYVTHGSEEGLQIGLNTVS